jgi:hypothetical protein
MKEWNLRSACRKMHADRRKAQCIAAFAAEQWHVRYWTTNKGKRRRDGYAVLPESQRNVSGTPIANFTTRHGAQCFCDQHNLKLAIVQEMSSH